MKFSFNKKLFFSHIFAVIIFAVISIISLNIGAKLYIEKQTTKNIMTVSTVMTKLFEEELANSGQIEQKIEPIRKIFVRLNQIIKSGNNLFDTEFLLINAKGKIINIKNEEAFVDENFSKKLIENVFDPSGKIIKTELKIYIDGKVYFANVVNLSLKSGREWGRLIVYSDLKGLQDLRTKLNFVLICIFLITGALVALFTVYLSKRISLPITILGQFAGKIANRDFEAKPEIFENHEIEELSQSMQKMANDLRNYDENMKKFMDNFSHEIRTPLTSISGYAEAIKFGVVEDIQNAAEIIIEESGRLKDYVEDVLYLSKLDSAEDFYKFETIDICDLVLESIGRITGVSIKNNKKIKSILPENSIEIFADGEKLQRAILNILSNGLRYAKNEVLITVKEVTIVGNGNFGKGEKKLSSKESNNEDLKAIKRHNNSNNEKDYNNKENNRNDSNRDDSNRNENCRDDSNRNENCRDDSNRDVSNRNENYRDDSNKNRYDSNRKEDYRDENNRKENYIGKDNTFVELEIVDDGPGLSEDVNNKIFDRFKAGEDGKFGLGLSIAKTIVERHRGTIFVSNSEYSGAVFTIRIAQVGK